MNLALDSKQNAKLNCDDCDIGLQKLRNCGGVFREKSKSPIKVNEKIYWQCPKSMTFNRKRESQIFNLYMTCKDNNTFPYGSEPMKQTAYCLDAFRFLDGLISDYHSRMEKKQKAEMDKASKA